MSAQARRTARAEAAHATATAANTWRCHAPGCPIAGRWQTVDPDTKAAAIAAADDHYNRNHYQPAD